MAYTNQTTHFSLGQFLGSDKPSWLTDYNGDMVKIDLALKSIQDLSSGADTKGTTALASITTINGQITSILTDIGLLNPYKQKVDDLEDEIILKAPLESPVFTGNPVAPDQALGNNSSRLANTKFVIDQIIAMAVRKDNASSPSIINGLWTGTQAEYDAIGTKDNNVLYFIQ